MNLEMEITTTFRLYKNQTFLHLISVLKLYMNTRHPPPQAWDGAPLAGRWSVRRETKPPDATAHFCGEQVPFGRKYNIIFYIQTSSTIL